MAQSEDPSSSMLAMLAQSSGEMREQMAAQMLALQKSYAGVGVVAAMKAAEGDAALQREGCMAMWNLAGSLGSVDKLLFDGGADCVVAAMRNHASDEEIQYYGAGAILQMAAKGVDRRSSSSSWSTMADRVPNVISELVSKSTFQAILAAMEGHQESVRIQSLGCNMILFFDTEVLSHLASHGVDARLAQMLDRHGGNSELAQLGLKAAARLPGSNSGSLLGALLALMTTKAENAAAQLHGCRVMATQARDGVDLPQGCVETVLRALRAHPTNASVLCSGFRALWHIAHESEERLDKLLALGAADAIVEVIPELVRALEAECRLDLGEDASRLLHCFFHDGDEYSRDFADCFLEKATEKETGFGGHGGRAKLHKVFFAAVTMLCRASVQDKLIALGAGFVLEKGMRTYGCDPDLQRQGLEAMAGLAGGSDEAVEELWAVGAVERLVTAMQAYAENEEIQEAAAVAVSKLVGESDSRKQRLEALQTTPEVAEAVRQIARPTLDKVKGLREWPQIEAELGGRPLEQIRDWLKLDLVFHDDESSDLNPWIVLVREVIAHCRFISSLSMDYDGGGPSEDREILCNLIAEGDFPKLTGFSPQHCMVLGVYDCFGLPEDSRYYQPEDNDRLLALVRFKIMFGIELLPDWTDEIADRVLVALDSEEENEANGDDEDADEDLGEEDEGVDEEDSYARREIPFGKLRGDLCEDRGKVLAAVKERAVALRFAAPELRRDREVLLAAVESTGNRVEFWDSEAAMWAEFEKQCVDPAVATRMRRWCEWKHGKEAADQMSFPEVHAQYVWYPQASAQPGREQYQNLGWAFDATLPEEDAKEEGEGAPNSERGDEEKSKAAE